MREKTLESCKVCNAPTWVDFAGYLKRMDCNCPKIAAAARAIVEAALVFEPVIGCVETADDIELATFREAVAAYRKIKGESKGTLAP